MLLEFIVNNAYSYKNEAYFSMEAVSGTKVQNEFPKFKGHRVLKSAIIFGANAAGKSNILNALGTFQAVVVKPDNLPLPFPSFAGNKEQISFAIVIQKSGVIYRYSLDYEEKKVVLEKLEIENNGEFEVYFERVKGKYLTVPEGLEIFTNKTRPENLFLNTAKTFNDEPSLEVYRWFIQDLLIFGSHFQLNPEILKNIEQPKIKENLLRFLRSADINIQDIEVVEQPMNLNINVLPAELRNFFAHTNFQEAKSIRLEILHKRFDEQGNRIEDFRLDLFSQESLGTQKILQLALIILLNKNKVILLDEFDSSLHNDLAKALLEVFNSEESSNQFILTSHELSFMDANFKREQIYFVERKDNGVSDLYSAYDFAMETSRRDYGYLKRYQKGQFGALPIVLVDSLKETLKEVR